MCVFSKNNSNDTPDEEPIPGRSIPLIGILNMDVEAQAQYADKSPLKAIRELNELSQNLGFEAILTGIEKALTSGKEFNSKGA